MLTDKEEQNKTKRKVKMSRREREGKVSSLLVPALLSALQQVIGSYLWDIDTRKKSKYPNELRKRFHR